MRDYGYYGYYGDTTECGGKDEVDIKGGFGWKEWPALRMDI